jgi:hypothetical protein
MHQGVGGLSLILTAHGMFFLIACHADSLFDLVSNRTNPYVNNVITRLVSIPFPIRMRCPEHRPWPQSTGVPYRCRPFSGASLSLLLSSSPPVTAAASECSQCSPWLPLTGKITLYFDLNGGVT